MLWVRVRDSLWFVPTILTVFGALLAVTLVQMERQAVIPWTAEDDQWLLAGDADGSRQLLSAIVGGLMTVTGVAFSVTIVALQLASSQFTPRVLRNFTADRWNQVVLGVLIGTFTYAMLVLRGIRSAGPGAEEFVPRVAVTVGVALTLISIGWLIYFINHVASSMRIAFILDRVTGETLRHIRHYYSRPYDPDLDKTFVGARPVPEDAYVIANIEAGYLQAVDGVALTRLAERHRLHIEMACKAGEFLLADQALAYVRPADSVDDTVAESIREAFVVGQERTPEQDVEFGIIEIADIAVKALSPGINDPTTAIQCIDRLSQILRELGCRSPAWPERSEQGRGRFTPCFLEFERALGLAFDQIRHFGASNPRIAKKLVDSLAILIGVLPPQRHAALIEQAHAVLEDARNSTTACTPGRELQRLEQEFQRVCQAAGTSTHGRVRKCPR